MGMRSNNYLALKAPHVLGPDVQKYLAESLVESNQGGSLYTWETNITPMWARLGRVHDLLEEVAIHQFLAALPAGDFLMKRSGDDAGVFGLWQSHDFREHPTVLSFEMNLEFEENRLSAAERQRG